MKSDIPFVLSQLFGCYFHQDWYIEYTNDDEAISDYLAGTDKATVKQALAEIEGILRSTPLHELPHILEELGNNFTYYPTDNVPTEEYQKPLHLQAWKHLPAKKFLEKIRDGLKEKIGE